MALIDDIYVPGIKWRQGEYQALLRLTDAAKSRIVPLITIPKIEYDFDDGTPKHTVQEHVEKFPTRYKQKWKARPAWIEVDQSLHTGAMTGGASVSAFVFDGLRKFGAQAVPVASIDYAPGIIAVLAASAVLGAIADIATGRRKENGKFSVAAARTFGDAPTVLDLVTNEVCDRSIARGLTLTETQIQNKARQVYVAAERMAGGQASLGQAAILDIAIEGLIEWALRAA